jgi:hypothetical protein
MLLPRENLSTTTMMEFVTTTRERCKTGNARTLSIRMETGFVIKRHHAREKAIPTDVVWFAVRKAREREIVVPAVAGTSTGMVADTRAHLLRNHKNPTIRNSNKKAYMESGIFLIFMNIPDSFLYSKRIKNE